MLTLYDFYKTVQMSISTYSEKFNKKKRDIQIKRERERYLLIYLQFMDEHNSNMQILHLLMMLVYFILPSFFPPSTSPLIRSLYKHVHV